MSRFDIFIMELMCADYMLEYGYDLEFGILGSKMLNGIRRFLTLISGLFYWARYTIRDSRV